MFSNFLILASIVTCHSWICQRPFNQRAVSMKMANPGETQNFEQGSVDGIKSGMRKIVSSAGGIAAATIPLAALNSLPAFAKDKKLTWEKVELPVKETLFDISFDQSKPDHGWLVGAKGTFLETFDGGATWKPRTFSNLDEDEEITYRFEVASLSDNEGLPLLTVV